MSNFIVKDSVKEKKDVGGHKPFGIDINPNKDLKLVEDNDRGQTAYYKNQKIKYLDYFGEVCDRGIRVGQGKSIQGSFGGFGPGKLKKPYSEKNNG